MEKKSINTKKENNKKNKGENDEEYYTEEEIRRLDKIHEKTDYKFDDDDIYQLMQIYKNDDDAIIKDLKEKGEAYQWEYIGKSNYTFFNLY